MVHLELTEPIGDYESEQSKLQHIVESCLQDNDVLITVNKVSALDALRIPASIRFAQSSGRRNQASS